MKTPPADLEALMPAPECYQNFWDEGITYCGVPEGHTSVALFTADQVREAIRGATERAAKLAAQLAYDAAIKYADGDVVDFDQEVGDAIRSGGEAGS